MGTRSALLASALTILFGAHTMAQDTTPPPSPPLQSEEAKKIDELKRQKELLDAQRAAAEAEKQFIDAQKSLNDARRVPSATEAATAEQVAQARAAKEVADAQKALADAQKAESDAQLAAFKAALGEVQGSGLTGAVTTGERTGEIEAALLAVKAVREAAVSIGGRVKGSVKAGSAIVIVNSTEMPTFQNLIAYKAEVAIVEKVLDAAAAAAAQHESRGPAIEAVPILGAAGLALDATTKLLSFFRTDYTIQGNVVTLDDRIALEEVANVVAASGFNVAAPLIYDAAVVMGATQFLMDDATRLAEKRAKLQPSIARLAAAVAALAKQLSAPDLPGETKITLEKVLSDQTTLLKSLTNASGLVDAWYTKLGSADAKGVAVLVNVAREKSVADALSKAHLLTVKVQKAGGNFLTKKNLWTVFGGMPLFHMGGAAVSYTLMDGQTGRLISAGVVPIHGGFVKVDDVRAYLQR